MSKSSSEITSWDLGHPVGQAGTIGGTPGIPPDHGLIPGAGSRGGATGATHGAGVGAGAPGGPEDGLLGDAGIPKSARIVSFDPTSPSAQYCEFFIVF